MGSFSYHVGQRIKKYRKSRGYTIEQFSAMINKSKATVSKYENGTITIEGIDHPHQLIFYDRAGGRQVLYQGPAKADMSGEIAEWLRLISAGPGSNIHNRYSLMALQVMDEARKQMGIVFPADETFA